MKIRNDEKVNLGKEVELYLPSQRINVYDQDHNKVNSREVVFENNVPVTVSNEKGQMFVKFGKTVLSYPEEGLANGEYILTFKQDKLLPIFPNKMVKKGYENPEMDNPKNKIKVSAYDEDVLGNKLLVYVAVEGVEKYCSFIVNNNFSVYKLPKFELFVPREAFNLKAK